MSSENIYFSKFGFSFYCRSCREHHEFLYSAKTQRTYCGLPIAAVSYDQLRSMKKENRKVFLHEILAVVVKRSRFCVCGNCKEETEIRASSDFMGKIYCPHCGSDRTKEIEGALNEL